MSRQLTRLSGELFNDDDQRRRKIDGQRISQLSPHLTRSVNEHVACKKIKIKMKIKPIGLELECALTSVGYWLWKSSHKTPAGSISNWVLLDLHVDIFPSIAILFTITTGLLCACCGGVGEKQIKLFSSFSVMLKVCGGGGSVTGSSSICCCRCSSVVAT